eukprot:Gb_20419 [translate_table: standard]
MDLYDYELELQSDFVRWRCSHDHDSSLDFIPKPRHIQIGMAGRLVWSIQVLPLPLPLPSLDRSNARVSIDRIYAFNIMDVACAQPDESLRHKFKLLLEGHRRSLRGVYLTLEEALDKFYRLSILFMRTRDDEDPATSKRWWMIVDAEITTVLCQTAKTAMEEAGKAAARVLMDCWKLTEQGFFAPKKLAKKSDQESFPVEKLAKNSEEEWFHGGSIEGWSVADELWATSFSQQSDDVKCRLNFLSRAVEEGNVLQWCSVKVAPLPSLSFECEIALQDFMREDEVVLRIGVANHQPLRVRVCLTENVEVTCSQNGIEPQTSLGLGYLLPNLVKDRIVAALKRYGGYDRNVVGEVLEGVVRYLVFLARRCVVCGNCRLLDVPPTSACESLCRARKQKFLATADAWKHAHKFEDKSETRREEFVRIKYSRTFEGCEELGNILHRNVAMFRSHKGKEETPYDDAVSQVAAMGWKAIAVATGSHISCLWEKDYAIGGLPHYAFVD